MKISLTNSLEGLEVRLPHSSLKMWTLRYLTSYFYNLLLSHEITPRISLTLRSLVSTILKFMKTFSMHLKKWAAVMKTLRCFPQLSFLIIKYLNIFQG